MKTNKIQIFFTVVFSAVSVFNAKSQDKLSQSLAEIKTKVQDVQIDKNTFRQSIDILDESKGKLSFVSELVDDKGKSSKERFEFYVSDIDKNTIIRKTSGKKLYISLTINNSQKFIKHYREEKLDSYTSNLEIIMSSADAATELISLFKTAIPQVNSGEKAYNTNKDALNWLKTNISKVSSGQVAFEQTFSFGEPKDYLAVFTLKKTDQKSASTDEKFEFSILDVNLKTLAVKVSGTQLSVSVEIKGNDSYIKYTRDNEQQSFKNNFEIIAEDIDQARNIIGAFTLAIEKSKPVMPDFGTLQKSLDFITKNTADLTVEKKTLTQKIIFTPGSGTKAEFTYAEPDSKGKTVQERYEFYLNDIDAGRMNFKVSGKKIYVGCISSNKMKFIKYYKDNNLQDFQNDADILISDIETAREMVEAFKAAIKSSGTQPAAWKNTGEAVAFLTATLTGETIGTDKYKLTFSPLSTEPLNVRYVTGKTDTKGVIVEQSYEFYPYMLDAASLKIVSSGKYLNVVISVNSKKTFIKVIKDGKQQSFDDGVELMATDARQAREVAEAIKYLAANSKPKDKVWSDKQAALKFITDNVTDMKNESKAVKQKIEMANNDPCKITYTVSGTDDKGKTTDEIFEFALSDMNKQLVESKVSGKTIEVILPSKNKEKLVKAYKNGEQQAWGAEVKIATDDVEKARNISEAFKSAIGQCEK